MEGSGFSTCGIANPHHVGRSCFSKWLLKHLYETSSLRYAPKAALNLTFLIRIDKFSHDVSASLSLSSTSLSLSLSHAKSVSLCPCTEPSMIRKAVVDVNVYLFILPFIFKECCIHIAKLKQSLSLYWGQA